MKRNEKMRIFLSFLSFFWRKNVFFMILNVIFWFLDHQNHVVSNLLRPAALFSLAEWLWLFGWRDGWWVQVTSEDGIGRSYCTSYVHQPTCRITQWNQSLWSFQPAMLVCKLDDLRCMIWYIICVQWITSRMQLITSIFNRLTRIYGRHICIYKCSYT